MSLFYLFDKDAGVYVMRKSVSVCRCGLWKRMSGSARKNYWPDAFHANFLSRLRSPVATPELRV